MTQAAQYDRTTIRLHWAVAMLVLLQWVVGRLNHLLPKGPVRLSIWSVHVLVGFALVAIIVWRLYWRATKGRVLPPAEDGPRHATAKTTHVLLYFLMVGVALLGVWNTFAHGFPLFNVWHFPKIGGKDAATEVNWWHGLFANLILGVALFHAAAALFHRYVLRDRVLDRMWPRGA